MSPSHPGLDKAGLDKAGLAMVAWSALAEPGDQVAHALVEELGAAEALQWVATALRDPAEASLELAALARRETVDRMLAAVERWRPRFRIASPEPHLERAAKVGARVVVRDSREWPDALNDLGPARPYCLWVRGPADLGQAWHRAVAIVGSRSSTAYGEHVAATLAAGLVDEGYAIISGGAFGIDARGHRAALAAGGTTVAVMAGGIDQLYPQGNLELLRRIAEEGAIVAEVPPGFAPHRSRFLTRNRIIAGARATVVVEAAHRSGALSTAFHAADMGRPVGAVPGPVTSAASAGCHRLIRSGAAVCVASASDVAELLEPLDAARAEGLAPALAGGSAAASRPDFAEDAHRRAYDALQRRGSILGEVASAAGLSAGEARAALGALELQSLAICEGVLWKRTRLNR